MIQSRRNFLKQSALVTTAIAASNLLPRSSAADASGNAPAAAAPSWIDKPMRWAQLTLVEDDPGKFDPEFWLDYFKRTRSDAVCLSAGGCVAFYPTKIPFHHRSQWLGESDPFGHLVAGCRKLGMVVIARTDPHATYDDVQAAHPDWIAVGADGQARRHWASPEMWVTCGLGPYNFEFMTEVKREIMALYKIDGIFINRWDGSGMCYCEHCQKNFKEASGRELPRTNNPRDPGRREYILWRQQRLFDLWRIWDREARAINPDSCVIPNTGGGASSSLNMQQIGELAPTLMADRQARRGVAAPWANGKDAKEFRAALGRKPIAGIFSVGLEEPYRWKDSVQNPAEFQLWAAEGVANDLRPWFTKFAGVIRDPRWLEPVAELYQRYARWEKYLRNEQSLARVAIVYSQQSSWFHDGPVEDHINGWHQALIEARIPFEMVHDRLLDFEKIKQYKTLILPNITCLSDQQCDQLQAAAERGISIVATHETSLYNEWGEKRKDFGLGKLFGVAYTGRTHERMQNAYLEIGSHEPILNGLENARRIIHGVARVAVAPHADGGRHPKSPLTLVPSYPDLPMEKVYPRAEKTEIGQLFLREPNSNARVVYFPWDIDRTFWEVLCVDHFKLLRNAVNWAGNEEHPVTVTGPGVLDVTVWRQRHSMTVHLVNLTNPMMMKGPIREFIPVGEQEIRLKLPEGVKPKRVHFLATQKSARHKISGGILTTSVPSILDHEVLALDL